MASPFVLSNSYLLGGVDLTALPQLVFTNGSSYTPASNLAAVTAQEISGNGYARPSLTVASNAINSDGYGQITYNAVALTASGGTITFDRVALIADGTWAGYVATGTQSITSGNSQTFAVTFALGESGVSLSGADGQPAYALTTGNFTQPAVAATVAVTVESTEWLVVGAYCQFSDGTDTGFYKVTAIAGLTSCTLQNLGYTGSASPGATMNSGGKLIPCGMQGIAGTNGTNGQSAYTLTTGSFTQPAVGASVTVAVQNTDWLAVGTYCQFSDGVDVGFYRVDLINSTTSLDLENLGGLGSASPGVTMNSGGKLVAGAGGGNGGQGYFLRYTAALAVTTTAAGEWGTDGTINGGTVDPITEFYVDFAHLDSVAPNSAYKVLAALGQNSIVKLYGESSGVRAWYRLDSVAVGSFFTFGVTLLDDDGDFTDGENLLVQFVNTPTPFADSYAGNFGLDDSSPRRYFVDCTSGNITATLPLAANAPGIAHLLKRTDNSGYTLTLARSGSDTIDGETSQTLAGLESVTVHSDGVSAWYLS